MSVRVFGLRCGPRSWALTGITTAVGLLWLLYPLIWPLYSGTRSQSNVEAVAVLGLIAMLVAAGWVGLWLDSSREVSGLGLAAALVAVNVAIRPLLNGGSNGVEVNYVLPLLAGAAGGGPAGFLVGATSCLLSQFSMDLVAPPLPGQIVVWGIAGLLGGLAHRLRLGWGWAWCLPLAMAFGPLAGVLLNLIGWPTETQDATSSFFFPGLPGWVNATRLLSYTWQTSFGYDLARGVTTAVGVLIVGLPVLAGLRHAWSPRISPDAIAAPERTGPTEHGLARQRRAGRLADNWNTTDTSQESPS
ncbi:hypothetical protein [Acidipropionibacterium jensenii]|uniref:ECF transporter S component n=1 Tax=Acidipropionibacterium jensenii TaxID=1749 RepID=A0A448NZP2_9ACTN|nr:hypothetical protein [Acidipropionibacterium jensenii]MDN5976374.1 hypothetical protein [Acidipropionibacterium jensenii]MDN5995598.1 hypothetical protein [Acidipropionibacterium jensenii]MDN6425660.1 hypothetical protein [Acidipropionibacterium jensenii]MDN6440572.1 hypothetical protein [Acidipropionibacterium jensenii]MDN6479440.1 hypothetical protein [Acidipropionibacterium jensenii]